MKHEKLAEALNQISDRHISEAAKYTKKRRPYWIGAVAAVLAVVILICGPGAPGAPAVQARGLIAAPEYPQMSPYPNESDFINPITGDFDSENYDRVYKAWREDLLAQRGQPEGYADDLTAFFRDSTAEFLSGAENENRVLSPLNVYMALAMLAEVSGGESRRQILELLNADSMDSLRTQAGQVWNAHYCADGASACVLAGSVWLDEGLDYNADTVNTLASRYYASVYRGDLGSPEMNSALQGWLDEQTGGLLNEQAQNVEMSQEILLALATTVYYRAKWTSEFQERNNTQDLFHAPGGDMTVTYMNRQLSYGPYYWGDDFGAVTLSLEDGSKMWLILPDEGKTPEDILESGFAMDMVLSGAWENETRIRVNLSLPKFDVASDLSLNEGLRRLGITDVFDPDAADFTPIFPEDPCWVDSVSHASRVKIDEEGVEAAAYTVIMMAGAGMPPEDEIDFVLDRPFLFVITGYDGLPLFAGVVNQP